MGLASPPLRHDAGLSGAPKEKLTSVLHLLAAAADPGRQTSSAAHNEDEELVWELRRLIASSGGTIADVALALEQRGDEVDRKARRLLHDEVLAIDVDLAALKTLLSDSVDWDTECKRLLADEVPLLEDPIADEYDGDEDD